MILLRKYVKALNTRKSSESQGKKVFIYFAVVLCFLTYSFSSNISFAENISVTGIVLDTQTLNMSASDTYNITATISPEDATNQNILWTSSDYSIAVVDDGEVTAFSEGTALITATTEDGAYSTSCEVVVSPLTPVSTNETVRIKLSMNEPSVVSFYLDGSYSIKENTNVSLPRQFYQIKLESGVLNFYYGDTILASGTTLTLSQHEVTDGQNNFLWINNYLYGTRRYLGDMKFIVSDSAILVVNHIFLEEYLWGVVPHEMSNSFPIEALKAQAVAARTYAVRNMGGTNYDFVDTSSNQVYKGYHPANDIAISAVNATSKTVLQYNSSTIVPTYYSASNGGYTEIPYHAWGGGYEWPFYIEYDKYDIANPSSPYEEVFFPVTIDNEHPVTSSDNVTGTPNISNAVLYFKTAIFNTNQLQIQGYNVTALDDFDLAGLLSMVQHTYDSGLSEDHNRMPNTGINNCVDFIMATADFKVTAEKDGITEEIIVAGVELDMRYFDGANDDDTYQVFNMISLRLTIVVPKYEAGIIAGYSIYQRRYGHGVGMSQRGAQQRANSGHTYEQILSFYYPESGASVLDIEASPLTAIVSSADNSNATVMCNDYLSVRTDASTNAERIFTLPPDARIEVVQSYYNETFHMINFGDKNYFIHADYVKIDDPVSVSGVSLSTNKITLEVTDTYNLTASLDPSNPTYKGMSWASNNDSIISIDEKGEITALSAGSAIVTVTTHDGGYTASCNVTVISSVIGIYLSPESHKILQGDTFQLEYIIQPGDATNKSVLFSTSDSAIVSVDNIGNITATGTGYAIVTVTTEDGDHTASCNISVVKEMIISNIYFVNRLQGYYENITIGTSVEEIIASVSNTLGDIFVYNESMALVINGDVSTGYYIQLIIDDELADTLRIVIEGDCYPDTILDIIDYTLIRLHILGVSDLKDIYLDTADVNDDGIIDIIDYTLVRLHILGVQDLY